MSYSIKNVLTFLKFISSLLILRSFGNFKTTVKPLGTDIYFIWSPLYYGKFVWFQQNANLFSLENTSVIRRLYRRTVYHVPKNEKPL